MVFDKALIEASFAMQYGIRLAKEDIAFGEYCRLLAGLMGDTPLGQVVAIRAEKNPEKIRNFGEYERGVRRKWMDFMRGSRVKPGMTPGQARGRLHQNRRGGTPESSSGQALPPGDVEQLQNALEKAFGG